MSEIVLACRGIERTYRDGALEAQVLKGVDLSLDRAQTLALVGASGSGKSTLLHILGGLDLPSAGEVEVTGQAMHRLSDRERGRLRNRALGFIYQFHHLLPEFTALENVAMPLLIAGQGTGEAAREARDLLEKVGLGHRLEHKPSELSGGERQRAAVARALVTRPACVLGDEPTGNLDQKNAEHIFGMMLELNRHLGTSFIIATHDLKLAQRMERCLELVDGRVRELD